MLSLVIAVVLGAAVPSVPLPPPCLTEDSVSCYWDAESRGNGRGWNRENHWTDGTCPKPERKLCGSCDAGLPMSYTCIEPPKESN